MLKTIFTTDKMEREKLLQEYEVVLDSLVEKTKFVYSKDFYNLDEFEKQKYNKDKMTTEAHLGTLCELLWGNKVQFDNGLGNMFALGLLSSMFSGSWGYSTFPKLDEKDFEDMKDENNAK